MSAGWSICICDMRCIKGVLRCRTSDCACQCGCVRECTRVQCDCTDEDEGEITYTSAKAARGE
jgi:hypothetical protein